MQSSRPIPIVTPRLRVQPLSPGDEPRLRAVFDAAPDWQRALGRPADPDAAAAELAAASAAPGRAVAVLQLRGDEEAVADDIGAIAWWRDKPEPGIALLGMLLVVPAQRRQGFAAEALGGVARQLRDEGMRELRTAFPRRVLPLHPLVKALGFAEMSIAEHQLLGLPGAGTSLWKKPLASP